MTDTRRQLGPSNSDEAAPNVRFVERETLPRHDRGIDWGERRRLIARNCLLYTSDAADDTPV